MIHTPPPLRALLLWPVSPPVVARIWKAGARRRRPPTPGAPALSAARHILVVRVDRCGDVVLTGPFLRELRRAAPQSRITLVVDPECAELAAPCPYVDDVRTLALDRTGVLGTYRRLLRIARFVRHHLRGRAPDLAILPRWGADACNATYLALFSGATRRVGFSESVLEERRLWNRHYDRLLTDAVVDPARGHEVEHTLALVRHLGGEVASETLELWLTPDDEASAERLMEAVPAPHRVRVLGLGPGAGHPRRQWPLDRFAAVGRWALAHGAGVLVVGGPGDAVAGERLCRELGTGAVSVAGRATWRQTAALLKRCAAFAGNDSAPLHVAAAQGLPVVAISCHPLDGDAEDSSAPERFGPWCRHRTVLRPPAAAPPCHGACRAATAHCILAVPADDVCRALSPWLVAGKLPPPGPTTTKGEHAIPRARHA